MHDSSQPTQEGFGRDAFAKKKKKKKQLTGCFSSSQTRSLNNAKTRSYPPKKGPSASPRPLFIYPTAKSLRYPPKDFILTRIPPSSFF